MIISCFFLVLHSLSAPNIANYIPPKFFFCVVFVFLLKTTTVGEKMAGWVLMWALPIVRIPEDPLRQQWVPSARREAARCHLPAFSCYQAPSPSHRFSYESALLSEKMTSLEGRAPCCSPFPVPLPSIPSVQSTAWCKLQAQRLWLLHIHVQLMALNSAWDKT